MIDEQPWKYSNSGSDKFLHKASSPDNFPEIKPPLLGLTMALTPHEFVGYNEL